MDDIFESINGLIVKTYGGLVVFWSIIAYVLVKFLTFLGGCMAEGAINTAMAMFILKTIQIELTIQ